MFPSFPNIFPKISQDSNPHLSLQKQWLPRRMVLGRTDSCAPRSDSAEVGCSGEALDSGAGG
jgi:hypothetical protein